MGETYLLLDRMFIGDHNCCNPLIYWKFVDFIGCVFQVEHFGFNIAIPLFFYQND